MEKVDFDKYADGYEKTLTEDTKFFGEESSYFAEYKIKIVKDDLGNSIKNILEYGCGIGMNIRYFVKYFPDAEITGCDISQKSIEIASKRNENVNFFHIDENELEKHFGKYDLIFVSCVFHHIEPPLREGAMNNIYKLLKDGGKLFFFEHNTYNPVTRHIVNTCVWDSDAILLKPNESLGLIKGAGIKVKEKKYTLFFPSFLKFLRSLEKLMWFIPMGGQYYIKAEK